MLELGKGAALTLPDYGKSLWLTDYNIPVVLTAWDRAKTESSCIKIRFWGETKRSRLSTTSILLLLSGNVELGTEGGDVVIESENAVDDAALSELTVVIQVFHSRRLHFFGCNKLKSVDTVRCFFHHVLGGAICSGVGFYFLEGNLFSLLLEDTAEWFTMPQQICAGLTATKRERQYYLDLRGAQPDLLFQVSHDLLFAIRHVGTAQPDLLFQVSVDLLCAIRHLGTVSEEHHLLFGVWAERLFPFPLWITSQCLKR